MNKVLSFLSRIFLEDKPHVKGDEVHTAYYRYVPRCYICKRV